MLLIDLGLTELPSLKLSVAARFLVISITLLTDFTLWRVVLLET